MKSVKNIFVGVMAIALLGTSLVWAGANGLEAGGSAQPTTLYLKGATGTAGTAATAVSSTTPMPGVAIPVYGTLSAHRTNVIANDTINTTNLNAIAVNMSAYSGAYVNVLINGTATFTPYWGDSVLGIYSASYYPTNITGTGATASSFYVPTKNSEKFAIAVTAGSSGFNTSLTVQGVNGL
jgi:hypothetical protein